MWVVKCKRADKINTEHARVCSIHFREEDFERDLKNELLGLPLRRILRKDAIPSINLPNQTRSENFNFDDENQPVLFESARLSPSNIRTLRSKNREIRKRALETLSTLSPKKKKIEKIDFQAQTDMTSIKEKEFDKIKQENTLLKKRCYKQELMIQNLQQKLRVARMYGREHKKYLKKQEKSILTTKIYSTFSKCFTQNQIKCLLNGKQQCKWSEEDIIRTLILRAISRKCYIYI